MKFTDRLRELEAKATNGGALPEWEALRKFLGRNAKEILALVEAAEKMQRMNGSCQRAMEQSGMNGVLSAMEKEQS